MSVTRRFGSVSKARATIRSGGANSPLRRLKAEETLKVRFLQQPDDWEVGWYHYIDNQFAWCNRKKDCEACVGGVKASKVILANVVDLKQNKVVVIQMTPTLADSVLKRYEKFGGTVMDRDYDLTREGSGLTDTRYSADYDPPKKRDLSRYDLHDIASMINAELGEEPDEEFPEDELPKSSKPASRKSRPVQEDEDDDFEDEDEESDEEDDFEEDEDELLGLDRSELKTEIRKYDPDYVFKKSFSDDDLRDTLRDLAADSEPSEEDEDEEEEDDIDYALRMEEGRQKKRTPPKSVAKKSATKKNKSRDAEDEFRPKKSSPAPVVRRVRRPQ